MTTWATVCHRHPPPHLQATVVSTLTDPQAFTCRRQGQRLTHHQSSPSLRDCLFIYILSLSERDGLLSVLCFCQTSFCTFPSCLWELMKVLPSWWNVLFIKIKAVRSSFLEPAFFPVNVLLFLFFVLFWFFFLNLLVCCLFSISLLLCSSHLLTIK